MWLQAGFAEEINRRVEAGLHYLNERIERHLNSSNWEQTWASMRWLAYSYQVRGPTCRLDLLHP